MPKIDISDLLEEDCRLDYNWRFAKRTGKKLHLKFPSKAYKVVEERSVVQEGVWRLYVQVNNNILAPAIYNQYLKIPEGIEKIIYGEIEQVNKR